MPTMTPSSDKNVRNLLTQMADHANKKLSRSNLSQSILPKLTYFRAAMRDTLSNPSGTRAIRSALISVYCKDGLGPIVQEINRLGITVYSTGGTQTELERLGAEVVPVEALTAYPSILGGRVKTLHPKVFGGILGRRSSASDTATMEEYELPPIDLVVVDLYPFAETVASGADEDAITEQIDIGGISLIRAAAKNHADVVVIPDRSAYGDLLAVLRDADGTTTAAERRTWAARAFAVTAEYDAAIHRWMAGEGQALAWSAPTGPRHTLRYGENPHQRGEFIGDLAGQFEQLNGKELSYNNLLDIDAATSLLNEFASDGPAVCIVKHNNACGCAVRPTLHAAWEAALAADPVSAFGGVIALNRPVDAATAAAMHELFFEVAIAPDFSAEALELLSTKKNRILLRHTPATQPAVHVRSVLGGLLVQEPDVRSESVEDLQQVTAAAASAAACADAVFAQRIAKHTRSNTIVFARDLQLLGSGTGQTSRVDALRQAVAKAHAFGFTLDGAVMASDAFFPFADCVELAYEAGVRTVVQPGGSVRDSDSIAYCDAHGMAMYLTGVRHFKH